MQDKYIIEQCSIDDIIITKSKIDTFFSNQLEKYSDEEYLYWDKIKYKPIPDWISNSQELRGITKFIRNNNIWSPVKTESWDIFKFWEFQFSKELLHELDKHASWTFFTNISETDKKLFITNGMLEEAISSSQLEWASTTTKNAKEMIQKWKSPTTKDEYMILNNYNAMNYIRNELVNKDLELWDLFYLQSILTKNTIDDSDIWRLRNNNDDIIVKFENKIAHIPPKEDFLNKEIKRLIDFANNKWTFDTFVHPVIKAIILHFWIWYLHPFCDGNWRTARAIFYWYLLKNDYFWFSYIPLSSVLKDSKIDYAKSYIYTEQDDFDLNYFINYNLRKIKIALTRFKQIVKQKFEKNHNNTKKIAHLDINERQKKLVIYFLENNDSFTNALTHMNYYWITKKTAIYDLKDLESKWFVYSKKSWKYVNYFPIDGLDNIINKKS